MKREYVITTFGLTDEQNSYIRACLPTKEYELRDYSDHCETDLIAHTSTVLILNSEKMSEEGRTMLWSFYKELNMAFEETVIWLGKPMSSDELGKTFKRFDRFDDVKDKLKTLLLEAHKCEDRAVEYSRILEKGLMVLSLIRNEPGISIKKICEKTQLSTRTAQRYIETLRTVGESIIYDRKTHGYSLEHGKSLVYGDYFDEQKENVGADLVNGYGNK